MTDMEHIRRINQAANYVLTMHSRRRMHERGIMLRDVIRAVETGEIIEQYPDDYPFPSCLILGISTAGRHLHTVLSLEDEHIYLITAYYPSADAWQSDMRTRREH